MRRHKAVVRIFLFLSIVNFTFAGLAQAPAMHETSVDLVTGVTEASERGYTQSEELPDWLGRQSTAGHLDSRDIIGSTSFNNPPGDPSPDDKKFFNKELNRKMKEYLVLGAIAGVFTGVANGIQKQILGTVSPNAQTVGRSVEPLDELESSGDQEDPVSCSLSEMGDEDLQSLSILLRRMLNRLG